MVQPLPEMFAGVGRLEEPFQHQHERDIGNDED